MEAARAAAVPLWFTEADEGWQTDALDGEPVRLFNLELRTADDEERELRGAKTWDRDGHHRLQAPPGRVLLTVHARGYESVEALLDVPDVDGPYEVRLALRRR